MNSFSVVLLGASTVAFIGAASAAKHWALSNSMIWLVATLLLYTLGNLIMLRLIRDVGMGVALSLSGVVQLAAVNLVALAFFGEQVTRFQAVGLVLAVVAVAFITLPTAR